MSLTWKDGLATVFVGAGAVLYVLHLGGTAVAGLSGPQALSMAVFALGVAACYTTKSQMAQMYGVGDRPRPPLAYVVLASVLGSVMLVAGIIAVVTGLTWALTTLLLAMVTLWALATIRHWTTRPTPIVIRTAH